MTKKKPVIETQLVTEILEDGYRDFNKRMMEVADQIQRSIPARVFQEKHTSGWLWNKKTYYTYYVWSEGRMLQLLRDGSEL